MRWGRRRSCNFAKHGQDHLMRAVVNRAFIARADNDRMPAQKTVTLVKNHVVLLRGFGIGAQRFGVFSIPDTRAVGETEWRDSCGVEVTREHPPHRAALAIFSIDDFPMPLDNRSHGTNKTSPAARSHAVAVREQCRPACDVKISIKATRLKMSDRRNMAQRCLNKIRYQR